MKAVHFSPEDVDLLSGPPSLRRRFLDISASQADETYLRNLMDYNHVVTQRNALLREIKVTGAGTSRTLGFWDMTLSDLAGPIVDSRTQFVSHLSRYAAEFFRRLSSGDQLLEFRYAVEAPNGLEHVPMREVLEACRAREIGAGQSLLGPHRDDLKITLGGEPVAGYGSRGQHRLIVLSLKFAQLQWLSDAAGELPILLLDDIFSELDSYHRGTVAQVFISAADIAGVPARLIGSAQVLGVESGSVEWKQADATSQ
jgi:DNA replication and repair protein RecF